MARQWRSALNAALFLYAYWTMSGCPEQVTLVAVIFPDKCGPSVGFLFLPLRTGFLLLRRELTMESLSPLVLLLLPYADLASAFNEMLLLSACFLSGLLAYELRGPLLASVFGPK